MRVLSIFGTAGVLALAGNAKAIHAAAAGTSASAASPLGSLNSDYTQAGSGHTSEIAAGTYAGLNTAYYPAAAGWTANGGIRSATPGFAQWVVGAGGVRTCNAINLNSGD